jgi:hypothetical protein
MSTNLCTHRGFPTVIKNGKILCQGCQGVVGNLLDVEYRELKKTILAEAKTILTEAGELVDNGDRQKDYGPPEQSFRAIADGWGIILKTKIKAEQVALCQIWLKIVRESNKHKRDNIIDIAGYARLVERLTDEQHNYSK